MCIYRLCSASNNLKSSDSDSVTSILLFLLISPSQPTNRPPTLFLFFLVIFWRTSIPSSSPLIWCWTNVSRAAKMRKVWEGGWEGRGWEALILENLKHKNQLWANASIKKHVIYKANIWKIFFLVVNPSLHLKNN